MVEICPRHSLGVMRYAVIIAEKCPIFVNFHPPDTENYDVGFHGSLGKRLSCDSTSLVSCSIIWVSSHPENMHSHIILHGRLPGISKEGQMLLDSTIDQTCVISLISNEVINFKIIIQLQLTKILYIFHSFSLCSNRPL